MKALLAVVALLAALAPVGAQDGRMSQTDFNLFDQAISHPGKKPAFPEYTQAIVAKAKTQKVPLVVFVGCVARDIPGCLVAQADKLGARKGVVVSWFDAAGVHRGLAVDLPATVSVHDIRSALLAKGVTVPAALAAVPAPFPQGGGASPFITPLMNVPIAGPNNGFRMVPGGLRTLTPVLNVGPFGGTNCTPFG